MLCQEEQWDLESLSNCLWSPNWQKWNWRSHTPDSFLLQISAFLELGWLLRIKRQMLGKGMRKRRKGGLENERRDEWTEALVLVFSYSIVSDSLRSHGTAACQAPLLMEFSRQEYWSRLSFPSPGHLPDPGIELASPALAGGFFTTATWEAHWGFYCETNLHSYLYWTPLIFSFLLSNNTHHLELLWGVFKMVHMRILTQQMESVG